MRRWMRDLLSERSDVSMMRLLSLICVLTASGIAIRAVVMDRDLSAAAVLCSVFLGAGIGGKAIQKVSEIKDVSR